MWSGGDCRRHQRFAFALSLQQRPASSRALIIAREIAVLGLLNMAIGVKTTPIFFPGWCVLLRLGVTSSNTWLLAVYCCRCKDAEADCSILREQAKTAQSQAADAIAHAEQASRQANAAVAAANAKSEVCVAEDIQCCFGLRSLRGSPSPQHSLVQGPPAAP